MSRGALRAQAEGERGAAAGATEGAARQVFDFFPLGPDPVQRDPGHFFVAGPALVRATATQRKVTWTFRLSPLSPALLWIGRPEGQA
jgi:hypothetical protein